MHQNFIMRSTKSRSISSLFGGSASFSASLLFSLLNHCKIIRGATDVKKMGDREGCLRYSGVQRWRLCLALDWFVEGFYLIDFIGKYFL